MLTWNVHGTQTEQSDKKDRVWTKTNKQTNKQTNYFGWVHAGLRPNIHTPVVAQKDISVIFSQENRNLLIESQTKQKQNWNMQLPSKTEHWINCSRTTHKFMKWPATFSAAEAVSVLGTVVSFLSGVLSRAPQPSPVGIFPKEVKNGNFPSSKYRDFSRPCLRHFFSNKNDFVD